MNRNTFYIFLFFGLLIRIIFASFSFHQGDLASWKYIGDAMFLYGISPFLWWAQGPFNAIPLTAFQFLNYLGIDNAVFLSVSRHLPFIIGDLLLLVVVYKICSNYFTKNKYLFTLIIWFNSVLIYVSSVHGQTEQWMIFFTLTSFYFLSKRKNELGFLTLGCAAAFKYLPIIIFPFLYFIIKEKKDLIRGAFLTIFPTIGGFLVIHFVNVLIYNDHNFFVYLLDRSGTIFGSFMPGLGDKRFIGTGNSIWGQLYQQQYFSKEFIDLVKNKWLYLYGLIYVLISFYCYRTRGLIFSKTRTAKEKFTFLCLMYAIIIFPFFWLYPQMAPHRWLNFLIPFFFVSFSFKAVNANAINVFSSFIILGNEIYTKGKIFFLLSDDLNICIVALIYLSLIIPPFLFSVRTKNDLRLTLVLIFTVCFLLIAGNNDLHSHLLLIANVIPLFLLVLLFVDYFQAGERYSFFKQSVNLKNAESE